MARYVARHFDETGRYRRESERTLAKYRESKKAAVTAVDTPASEPVSAHPAPAAREEISPVRERAVEKKPEPLSSAGDLQPAENATAPQARRLTPQEIEEIQARHAQWAKERESHAPAGPYRLVLFLIWTTLMVLAALIWIVPDLRAWLAAVFR